MSLAAQQQALLDAILSGGPAPAGMQDAGAGIATYRGNLRALAARALASVAGSVQAELGEDDFAAMAWRFWREHPPVRGDLGEWGDELAGFLARHAGEDSGLPHLARRDWALHRAERAEEVALDADSLGLLADTPPERLRLCLRPGVVLVDGAVLVWRQGWRAQWQVLPAPEAAFVAALLHGDSLQTALEQAEVKGMTGPDDHDSVFDFGAWLQRALQQAWLHAARPL